MTCGNVISNVFVQGQKLGIGLNWMKEIDSYGKANQDFAQVKELKIPLILAKAKEQLDIYNTTTTNPLIIICTFEIFKLIVDFNYNTIFKIPRGIQLFEVAPW